MGSSHPPDRSQVTRSRPPLDTLAVPYGQKSGADRTMPVWSLGADNRLRVSRRRGFQTGLCRRHVLLVVLLRFDGDGDLIGGGWRTFAVAVVVGGDGVDAGLQMAGGEGGRAVGEGGGAQLVRSVEEGDGSSGRSGRAGDPGGEGDRFPAPDFAGRGREIGHGRGLAGRRRYGHHHRGRRGRRALVVACVVGGDVVHANGEGVNGELGAAADQGDGAQFVAVRAEDDGSGGRSGRAAHLRGQGHRTAVFLLLRRGRQRAGGLFGCACGDGHAVVAAGPDGEDLGIDGQLYLDGQARVVGGGVA